MGWGDTFRYGMYAGHSVRAVFESRPSYLVWTITYHERTQFTGDVLAAVEKFVSSALYPKGCTTELLKKYRERQNEGVPW